MNPSGIAWSGFAILCLLTVLVGVLILWSRRSGLARLRPLGASPAVRAACAIAGLVCLGVVVAAELRTFRAASGPANATWRRVVEAAPEAAPGPERFHVLAAVYEGPAGAGPTAVHEVVAPVRGPGIEHTFPSLGLSVRLRVGEDGAPEGELSFTSIAHSHWSQQRGWLRPEAFDLGDGQPFRLIQVLDVPQKFQLGLVDRLDRYVLVLGRGLSCGEGLELEPAPAAEPLARALRPVGLPPLWPQPRSGSDDPVGRVARRINAWGLIVFMSGLLFLLLGVIPFVQAAAVAIVVPLVLTSALIRTELALGESGLDRDDPAARVRALTRVAGATLFPSRASEVLLRHFSQEEDEEVRADLVELVVALPFYERGRLLERAEADPSELVRKAAARARQQKSGAGD
jgi:hypothetical protein